MSTLLSFEESLDLIRKNAILTGTETCSLESCQGRRLATPITARVSRPPAAVSAMDGYAVRLQDVAADNASLSVIGQAPAGTPFNKSVAPGEAVRIFTGGELPNGANHVVPQELVSRDGNHIKVSRAYDTAAHVRAEGVDFNKGEVLLAAGTRLGAAELAVAAAANYGELQVATRPLVALLSNGNELKRPGSELAAGEIISSNPSALGALLTSWGADIIDLGIAGDSVASIQSHIAIAESADLIVPIGGASVGDHDHMRTAFADLAYQPIFEKVAVKPGKPTWFSRNDRQYVLGLPGNPASAMVCAHLFLPSLLDPNHPTTFKKARLTSRISANGNRTHFLRAAAHIDSGGQLRVTPASNQDSSLLTPFLTANCLIHQPPDSAEFEPNELIDILPIGSL